MTHVMAKGANISLTAAAVRAVLRWTATPGSPDVDASALLIGTNGKVRSDADFVFYNQPRHPSGVVRHLPKQQSATGGEVTDSIEIDLAKLPDAVDRVVLAGSAEGGTFPAVAELRMLLHDSDAAEGADPIAEFTVTDPGEVSALVAAELYRRDGGWKFRAISQGYAAGLGGLATDFGITVEDEATEPAAPPAPNPDPREEPGTYTLAPAVPKPTTPPATPPSTSPAEAPAAAPVTPSPAPPAPPAYQPGYGYPQPTQPAPQPQPQPAAYGYPPQPQPAAYGYPPQPQPAAYGYPPQQQPGYGHLPPPPPQPVPTPQQPEQDPFALPPQGPQFQPR